MKASQVIRERLEGLGYEVLSPPKSNPYWRSGGWRSAGTCCWSATLRRSSEGQQDLLCWTSMAEMVAVPVERWELGFGPKFFGSGFEEWTLDIKPET